MADFGIRGVHLAYELLDGYDALVLVDALPMGEPPGTLAVIEPEPVAPPAGGDDVAPVVDAHSMSPGVVLGMLAGLGGTVGRIVVVGCEPATVEDGIGLSSAVAEAVDPAVGLCAEVLAEVLGDLGDHGPTDTHRGGVPPMIRRLMFTLVLAAVVGAVVKSLPDVTRYLKMRDM